MIRLGLRLTLNGGKESLVRLVVTALAVSLGVGMLLVTLAGINALEFSEHPCGVAEHRSRRRGRPARTPSIWIGGRTGKRSEPSEYIHSECNHWARTVVAVQHRPLR